MEEKKQEVIEQDVQQEETEEVVEETKPEVAEYDPNNDVPDADEKEQQLQDREAELFRREVDLTLKENGLEMYADVIKVNDGDELKAVVMKLKAITNDIKASAGYVPKGNAKEDAYTEAQQKGDTKGMIKSLFKF